MHILSDDGNGCLKIKKIIFAFCFFSFYKSISFLYFIMVAFTKFSLVAVLVFLFVFSFCGAAPSAKNVTMSAEVIKGSYGEPFLSKDKINYLALTYIDLNGPRGKMKFNMSGRNQTVCESEFVYEDNQLYSSVGSCITVDQDLISLAPSTHGNVAYIMISTAVPNVIEVMVTIR